MNRPSEFSRVRQIMVYGLTADGWVPIKTVFCRNTVGYFVTGYQYGPNDPNIHAFITPLGQRLEPPY